MNKATTDDGVTPLYIACLGGHIEVVGMLLTCDGIDVNKAKTDIGATPLFMACQNGRTEVVQMLLDAGANPTVGGDELPDPQEARSGEALLQLARQREAMVKKAKAKAGHR